MTPELIQQLILLVTPFVVNFATAIAKKLFTGISGFYTLIVAVVLSAGVTYVSGLVITGSPHWYFQFLIGLLAIVIDQFKKQWDASHSA